MGSVRHFVAAIVTTLAVACSPSAQPDETARYSVSVVAYDTPWKFRGIKALRDETGLGLADANRLIESSPGLVRSQLRKSDAEALADRLRASGITAEVRRE